MLKQARIDTPGALHHIIRGIEGQKNFRNNNDCDDLLTDLRKILPETLNHCESVCSKRGKNRRRDGAWPVA